MKRLSLAIALTLFTLPLLGQTADLSAPVARTSEAKYKVFEYGAKPGACSCGLVIVSITDASGTEIRQQRYDFPDTTHATATLDAWHIAIGTIRSGETGTVSRKANFRILGFLVDQGYITGVTLVP